MNDGKLPFLYTKETREVCDLLCAKQSNRAAEQTEQQSSLQVT